MNKAKGLDLKDGGLYISFGFNYAKRRQYSKAAEAFYKAIELDKNSFWGYNNRAWVSVIQGRCGPAQADLEKAQLLAYGRHNLYSNLAMYYWSCRRDKDKAIANFAEAFSRGYEHKSLLLGPDAERLMQGLYDNSEFKALLDRHRPKTGDAGLNTADKNSRP